MSSIKLKHSGGNSVSLNPPTSAPTSSEVAFKLPTSDGTAGQVLKTDGSGNLSWVDVDKGPAFHVRLSSAQSAPSVDTFTKIAFDSETFDTDGKFASSRFTPTVAGYYQINGGFSYANGNYSERTAILGIRKNGSPAVSQSSRVGGFESRWGFNVSGLIYLDTDDYVELFIYGPSQAIDQGSETYFTGTLVRKA